VPNISLLVLKPTFLEILWESHIVMIRVRFSHGNILLINFIGFKFNKTCFFLFLFRETVV